MGDHNPIEPAHAMPRRDRVHPWFDGHAERPWRTLTPDEKLAWTWETMRLLNAGAAERPVPARADR
jgi:hypothetical protein